MNAAPTRSIFDVLTDFLAANPTPDDILTYRLPVDLEQRATMLLTRQRLGDLTNDEEQEVTDFLRADNLLTLLKTKTRLRQAGTATV
jgi:hypothetical protein